MLSSAFTRFPPLAIARLCLLVALGLMLFEWMHWQTRNWLMFSAVGGMILVLIGCGVWIHRHRELNHGVILSLLLGGNATILLAIMDAGAETLIWAYPMVAVNFALLRAHQGIIINGVFTLLVIGLSVSWASPIEVLRISLTLMILLIFLHLYSLQTAHQQQLLNQIACTDPLTGVSNRFAMEDELKSAIDHSRRYQTPVSLVLLDMDRLKQINDEFGHKVGDRAICETARLAQTRLRRTDRLFRIGGDEFLILAVSTPQDQALVLARDICALMPQALLPEGVPLSLSCGVAQLSATDQMDSWMIRTDQAMYQAKQAGGCQARLSELS